MKQPNTTWAMLYTKMENQKKRWMLMMKPLPAINLHLINQEHGTIKEWCCRIKRNCQNVLKPIKMP